MKLHITQLILWPERAELEPVVIPFTSTKVGVITGWSETGKSSIVAIVDYVLGSEKCAIPVGPIRDTVSWYGLRLDTSIGTVRIARRSPHDADYSNDFELLTHDQGGTSVDSRPTRNTHLDEVKLLFGSLSGLSDLPLVTGEQPKGWSGRAAFRDMAAFNFLPQHIVANPHTLFFKTDTTEHRERLRRVFPVVLGMKSNEQLVLEHRIALLQGEERRLGAELNRRSKSIETWRAQVTGSFFRAQELGLLPAGDPPNDVNAIANALAACAGSPREQLRRPPSATTQVAVERLETLRKDEDQLNVQLGNTRRQLRSLRALQATVSDYGTDLLNESTRVRGIDWFSEATRGEHECPMCGTRQQSALAAVERLREPMRELEALTQTSISARPRLDKEIFDIEVQTQELEKHLFTIRRTRQELEVESQGKVGAGQRLEDVYTFVGEIRQALRAIGEVEDPAGLTDQYGSIVAEIRRLEEQRNALRTQAAQKDPLKLISTVMKSHAGFMSLGHGDMYPVLDMRELNIRFFKSEEQTGKSDLLWEIGSGANWMGYHLASFLALHEVLSTMPANPVPSFLIIDQPSQVYFPSDTYRQLVESRGEAAEDRNTDGSTTTEALSDIAKTRKIFELLTSVLSRGFDIQLIVLEHADEMAWAGLEEKIEKVRDWRSSGDKLVPATWLSRPT